MAQNPKVFGKVLRLSWPEIIMGLAVIVLGFVLTIWPGIAASVVLVGIGAVGVVIGIVHIVKYFMLEARAAIVSNDLALGLTWLCLLYTSRCV